MGTLRNLVQGYIAWRARRSAKVLDYDWTFMNGDEVIVHKGSGTIRAERSAQAKAEYARNMEKVRAARHLADVQKAAELQAEAAANAPAKRGRPRNPRETPDQVLKNLSLKQIKTTLAPHYPEVAAITRKSAMAEFFEKHPEAITLL